MDFENFKEIAQKQQEETYVHRYYVPNAIRGIVCGDDLFKYWIVGGYRENSSWSRRDEPVEIEAEPSFDSLDKFLEGIVPEIPYLRYVAILRDVVKVRTENVYEMYEGSTEYCIKSVNLRELYEFLVSRSILPGETLSEQAENAEVKGKRNL